MTAREVIKLACEYLGNYDLLKVTELGGTETATEAQQEKLTTMLTCLNDVVQTLALMYMPLKKVEELSSSTKQFEFSKFSKPVLQIIKVFDQKNNALPFKSFPEYFTTNAEKIKVEYHYQPAFASGYNDTLDIAEERCSVRLLAIGVMARFYLYQGLYQEATAWDNMFERAVLVANAKGHGAKIKKRGWYQ